MEKKGTNWSISQERSRNAALFKNPNRKCWSVWKHQIVRTFSCCFPCTLRLKRNQWAPLIINYVAMGLIYVYFNICITCVDACACFLQPVCRHCRPRDAGSWDWWPPAERPPAASAGGLAPSLSRRTSPPGLTRLPAVGNSHTLVNSLQQCLAINNVKS